MLIFHLTTKTNNSVHLQGAMMIMNPLMLTPNKWHFVPYRILSINSVHSAFVGIARDAKVISVEKTTRDNSDCL